MGWILLKDLADRWRGAAVIVVAIFASVWMGLVIYQTMDLAIFDVYPDPMLRLIGMPEGAGPEVLAYDQMLTFMGGISLSGLAVAIGADIVAGEERRRTLATVLSHPVSRLRSVLAKAAVLVLVVAGTSLALWGVSVLAARIVGVDVGEAHLGQLCLALGANALLYGAIAFAIGGVTGNKGLAGGIGAAVLVFSWLGAGLLPMWPEYVDYARWMPWYWYTEPQVLVNGIDGGYLGLSLGTAAAALAVGVLAFPSRDLKHIPPTSLVRRLTRSRRASTVLGLAFGRSLTLLVVVAAVMGLLMGVAMGPIYEELAPGLATMMEGMPPDMMTMFGADDMSTPEGFYWGETMGMMAPAAVITVVAVAAAGLAAEERSGRLAVVLGAPVSRSRVLAAAATTVVLYNAIVSLVTALGIWAGSGLGGMGIEAAHIFGSGAHLFALGLLVGGIALLVAAATGSGSAATWTAVGIGVVGHFGGAMLLLSEDTADYARISPFYYYSSTRPLENGADWGHVAILLAVGVVAIALALPSFRRRDLAV